MKKNKLNNGYKNFKKQIEDTYVDFCLQGQKTYNRTEQIVTLKFDTYKKIDTIFLCYLKLIDKIEEKTKKWGKKND